MTTVGEHYYEVSRSLGLTVQEARMLFILGAKPANMLGLRSSLRVPKSTMTGLVTRMEAAGLIVRERDPQDRRHFITTATAEGERVANDFGRELAARVETLASGYEPEERAELAGILSDFLETVDR